MVENAKFIYLICIQRPRRGWPLGISQRYLVLNYWQTRMTWLYHMLKKVWSHANHFWYNTGVWRTDGQTNGIPSSISRVGIGVLVCDKNMAVFTTNVMFEFPIQLTSTFNILCLLRLYAAEAVTFLLCPVDPMCVPLSQHGFVWRAGETITQHASAEASYDCAQS